MAGYLQLVESKLKALSVAVRLRKPDKRFETIKNYGIELQVYLSMKKKKKQNKKINFYDTYLFNISE